MSHSQFRVLCYTVSNMKSPKPEGIWKSLRIVIILLVANILLVTNFYIYSMYINNQSMDLTLSAQSMENTPVRQSAAIREDRLPSLTQVLKYDLPEGYYVAVKPVNWPLSETAIKSRISACKTEVDSNQIISTVDAYKDVKGIEYTFGKEAVEGTYTVTVYPNKRFAALEDAQKILSICPDGGQLSPQALAPSGIIFTDSCGNGTEGQECQLIKTTIEPTLSVE